MKKYILFACVIALTIVTVPLMTLFAAGYRANDFSVKEKTETDFSGETIAVYISKEQTTEEMNFRDYIIGVIAAEMPAVFHSEALSALTCAAATLARKNMQSGGDKSLDGAVISTDSTKHQAYMSVEEMKEKWGKDFDLYYKKLCEAVDKAIDYSITYENELIIAAYHAISPGQTEEAGNIWGKDVPYLTGAVSDGDKICEKYYSEKTVSFEDFRKITEKEGAALPEDKSQWFDGGKYTDAGTLEKIKIGGKYFSGSEIRKIFSLRSAAVKMGINSEGVVFSVKGYGHGVGLSQYGADYLARQGYTWQEIIKHYYSGVEIEII